ncbi:MAG: phosphotransferase [Propioniciclava sp.]|uniref:phosphotransferase enzyme family protein n=1 Tax=Propioniciclava sp. TaxID=2038686 RepID=UPI0039E719B6
MVSAPCLLAAAIHAGLVPVDLAGRGQIGVASTARSNPVHRIDAGGVPVAFVKQAGLAARLAGADPVAVESRVLGLLAGSGLVPALLPQRDPRTVWTRPAPGRPLLEAVSSVAALDAAARGLGGALARLHGLPVDAAPAATVPWPLASRRPAWVGAVRTPGVAAVLDALGAEPLRSALAAAASAWTPRGWVHGDVSALNVFVDGPRVTFIDLEDAGLGHPDWDVVCALDTLAGLDPRPEAPAASVFLDAYGRPEPAPVWWTLRTVMTAWQLAAANPDEELSAHYLDRARALAA